MPPQHRRNTSRSITPLFAQILTWSIIIWMLLLSITLGLTLRFSLNTFQEKIDDVLTATTASLAKSSMVRQALQDGSCPEALIEYLDDLVEMSADLDVLSISNADSIRIYHINHQQIGLEFVGDDQGPALAGESYLSDAVGTMGLQHRSFSPVLDARNEVIGFVLASTTNERMQVLRSEIVNTYGRLAVGLFLITLVFAGILSLVTRRLLHGFGPEELVHSYLTQHEVLANLDEGLISVDGQGQVQLVNRATEQMLGRRSELLEGSALDVLLRTESGESLTQCTGDNIPTSRPNILANCISLEHGGKRTGTTLILKDKSEAMRQAEQLNGTRHIVTALRANSHEFMNKLQVISGLLQMDRPEDALDYIGRVSATQTEVTGPVLQHILNPNVAALLLAKLNHMRELDIQLTVLANSFLPEHSQYLSTGDLVTVIGNLLENAMEAINAQCGNGPRSIVLQITEDENGLLLIVSDTGVGIDPDILPHIYEPGFSTKADDGRGVGMTLINEIADRQGGSIEIDSEPGSGTTFTLIFSRKRQRT